MVSTLTTWIDPDTNALSHEIWTHESSCYALNNEVSFQELYRQLKPGGEMTSSLETG